MRTATVLLALVSAACLGCDKGGSTAQSTTTETPKAAPVQPPVAAPVAPPHADSPTAEPAAQTAASQADQPAPGMIREQAKAGAGKQGRNYGTGPIATPVEAYWNLRQKAEYDIKIPGAMRLFKAEHDRNPTDAEFQQMLKDNAVNLPVLPEGERYVYDAQTGQLMVERPAPAQ